VSTISLHSTAAPQRTPVLSALRRFHQVGWTAAIATLSAATLLIHGYHPLAEDGGLYIAGVEFKLNPILFPHDTAFVTAHLRYSIFAPLLAGIVRTTHLPLDWVVFLAYLASAALTFLAAHQLLRRCVLNATAQLAGMALLAAWWTLPIAGTSLLLMDPYLTARSFSTPFSLLAVAFALDDWPTIRPRRDTPQASLRSPIACTLCLLFAALFHPLMAAYTLAFLAILQLVRSTRRRVLYLLPPAVALLLAATLQHVASTDSTAATTAALSRYYWFPSQWQWYELCGLAGPLLVFALLLRWQAARLSTATAHLLRAGICLGCTATVVALIFARQNASVHLVARLQPLRSFLLLYAIMALLLGANLTQALLSRSKAAPRQVRPHRPRWLLAAPFIVLPALALTSFIAQRNTFPASPHIELPGHEARNPNPWVRAFLWIRTHTPTDAVFALDARYINQAGEDAQTFRAWAQRSALPDFSKDGGEAAITPRLAPRWQQAATAQRDLSIEDDGQRDPRIRPLGATWIVVHSSAPTQHPCPYDNGTVKVCHLTE
jgi:hypothetical protein